MMTRKHTSSDEILQEEFLETLNLNISDIAQIIEGHLNKASNIDNNSS